MQCVSKNSKEFFFKFTKSYFLLAIIVYNITGHTFIAVHFAY